MKTIDVRLDELQIKNLVGQTFISYRVDTFLTYGNVGIITDVGSFAITNTIEVMDYYGSNEDVAIFRFEEGPVQSMFDNGEMADVEVGKTIKEVRVINEHQRLFKDGEQTYDVHLTRGLIFVLEDDEEISFEKSVWFSEMIKVERGKGLIERYGPTSEFVDDWDEPYHAECERMVARR